MSHVTAFALVFDCWNTAICLKNRVSSIKNPQKKQLSHIYKPFIQGTPTHDPKDAPRWTSVRETLKLNHVKSLKCILKYSNIASDWIKRTNVSRERERERERDLWCTHPAQKQCRKLNTKLWFHKHQDFLIRNMGWLGLTLMSLLLLQRESTVKQSRTAHNLTLARNVKRACGRKVDQHEPASNSIHTGFPWTQAMFGEMTAHNRTPCLGGEWPRDLQHPRRS